VRRRLLRVLPIAWLLGLLLAPGAAFVLGARQGELENRPIASWPERSLTALGRERTFQQLDRTILERLPLRGTALDLRGRLELDLLRDSPNPRILVGRDGWLYYDEELDLCRDAGRPLADPADAAELVARALGASGRRAIVTVADTKLSVHPADAPALDDPALGCVRRLDRRVGRRLARSPGGLDLRPTLDALERRGIATFLRSDTHWSLEGRTAFVRAVLDRIRPGLADEVELRPGAPWQRDGDLGRFMGMRRLDPDRPLEARRTPRAPLAAGDVALIGDSQLELAMVHPPQPGAVPIAQRALPGQPFCHVNVIGDGPCDAALRRARAVVLERVSRSLRMFTAGCWRPIAIALEDRTGPAGRWERADGGRPLRSRRLALSPAPVRVRALLPGGDVSAVPRIVRIPIRRAAGPVTMTQTPERGPVAPCSTIGDLTSGTAKLLAVPAGRRASDLLVQLSAPPGTELGAPEELVLDGRELRRAPAERPAR